METLKQAQLSRMDPRQPGVICRKQSIITATTAKKPNEKEQAQKTMAWHNHEHI